MSLGAGELLAVGFEGTALPEAISGLGPFTRFPPDATIGQVGERVPHGLVGGVILGTLRT